jgi:hypothetical protein
MLDQNPKMFRKLRESGEFERFLQLKANEAHRLYQELTRDAPRLPNGEPTLQSAREAEEHVRAMMFEFPDDTGTAEQDETKALFHEEPPQENDDPESSMKFAPSQHLRMAALLQKKGDGAARPEEGEEAVGDGQRVSDTGTESRGEESQSSPVAAAEKDETDWPIRSRSGP